MWQDFRGADGENLVILKRVHNRQREIPEVFFIRVTAYGVKASLNTSKHQLLPYHNRQNLRTVKVCSFMTCMMIVIYKSAPSGATMSLLL